MNSCLYKATVMHNRLSPKEHSFHYDIFMFYLDLNEIDTLSSRLKFMSRNKFNLFNFRDKDHLQLPREKPDTVKNTRQHIKDYLAINSVQIGEGKIMVLTNLCTLGYQFNPVSFYFCYNELNEPVCSVVEICNTFKEMKPYFLGGESLNENRFKLRIPKFFYVSPFIDMDTYFDFDLNIPDQKMKIKIDDYDKEGNRFFISTLTGEKKPLTDVNLLIYFFSFPLITLKVITLIHWQALKLWLKKLPFHKKEANTDLQREVFRAFNKTRKTIAEKVS